MNAAGIPIAGRGPISAEGMKAARLPHGSGPSDPAPATVGENAKLREAFEDALRHLDEDADQKGPAEELAPIKTEASLLKNPSQGTTRVPQPAPAPRIDNPAVGTDHGERKVQSAPFAQPPAIQSPQHDTGSRLHSAHRESEPVALSARPEPKHERPATAQSAPSVPPCPSLLLVPASALVVSSSRPYGADPKASRGGKVERESLAVPASEAANCDVAERPQPALAMGTASAKVADRTAFSAAIATNSPRGNLAHAPARAASAEPAPQRASSSASADLLPQPSARALPRAPVLPRPAAGKTSSAHHDLSGAPAALQSGVVVSQVQRPLPASAAEAVSSITMKPAPASPHVAPAATISAHETFAALDAGNRAPTPLWTHAGPRQAEAGYQDQELGWVAVRAQMSADGIHASLVPGSAAAAQALGGHLAGLSAHLAEQHLPVATLAMSPENRQAAGSTGQGNSGNPGHDPGQSSSRPEQPAVTTLSRTRSSSLDHGVIAPNSALAGGMYVSVIA